MDKFLGISKDGWIDLLRNASMDALFVSIPLMMKKISRNPSEKDKQVIAEAQQQAAAGKRREALAMLHRHFAGFGKADEQLVDQDMAAAVKSGMVSPAKMRELEAWLAASKETRSFFRNALTLQEQGKARILVIAEYANLANNAERDTRLVATGKTDDEVYEEVWKWLTSNVPNLFGAAAGGAAAGGQGFADRIVTAVTTADDKLNVWGLAAQAKYQRPVRTGWGKALNILKVFEIK